MKLTNKFILGICLLSGICSLGYAQSTNQPTTGNLGKLDKVTQSKRHRVPIEYFIEVLSRKVSKSLQLRNRDHIFSAVYANSSISDNTLEEITFNSISGESQSHVVSKERNLSPSGYICLTCNL